MSNAKPRYFSFIVSCFLLCSAFTAYILAESLHVRPTGRFRLLNKFTIFIVSSNGCTSLSSPSVRKCTKYCMLVLTLARSFLNFNGSPFCVVQVCSHRCQLISFIVTLCCIFYNFLPVFVFSCVACALSCLTISCLCIPSSSASFLFLNACHIFFHASWHTATL